MTIQLPVLSIYNTIIHYIDDIASKIFSKTLVNRIPQDENKEEKRKKRKILSY